MRTALTFPTTTAVPPVTGALIAPNIRVQVHRLPKLIRRPNTSGLPVFPARTSTTGALVAPNIRVRTRQLPRLVRPATSGQVPIPRLSTVQALILPNIRARTKQLPRIVRSNSSDLFMFPPHSITGALVVPNVRVRTKVVPRLVRPNTSGKPAIPQAPMIQVLISPNNRVRTKVLPVLRRPTTSGYVPLPQTSVSQPLIPTNIRKRVFTAFRLTPRATPVPLPLPVVPQPNIRSRVFHLPIVRRPESGQAPASITPSTGPLIEANTRPFLRLPRLFPRPAGQVPVIAAPVTPMVPEPNVRSQVHPLPKIIRRPTNSGQAPITPTPRVQQLKIGNVRKRPPILPRIVRPQTAQAEYIMGAVNQLESFPAGFYLGAIPLASGTRVFPVLNTPGISRVGALQTHTAAGATTMTALGVNVGDLLIVQAQLNNHLTPGITILSIATSGTLTTTAWKKAINYYGTGRAGENEIWYAEVTGVGSGTLTFTWSSSVSTYQPEYDCQEFSVIGADTWVLDTTGHLDVATPGTALDFPILTPQTAGELYWGFVDVANFPETGSTAGYGWPTTANTNLIALSTHTTAAAQSPSSTQNAAPGTGGTTAIAALFRAISRGGPAGSPVITGLSPNNGAIAGGTSVTIYGLGFTGVTGAAGVKFGSVNATSYTVNSNTSITAVAPAGISLVPLVDVIVTNPTGPSTPTTADYYRYTQANGIIYPVGIPQGYTDTAGGLTIPALLAHNVGDLLVFTCTLSGTNGPTLSSMSITSGALTTTTWTKVINRLESSGNGDNEMWWAKVTAAGTGVLTTVWSSPISGGSYQPDYLVQEFGATGGYQTWAVDISNFLENSASTTITWPSLTPTGGVAHELYVGLANPQGDFPTNGATSGYQYPLTMGTSITTFNPNCGTGAQQPTATQNAADPSTAIGALFKVSP